MPKRDLPEDHKKDTGLEGVFEPQKDEELAKPPTLLSEDPNVVPGTQSWPAGYTGLEQNSDGTPGLKPPSGWSSTVVGEKDKPSNPKKPK